MCETTPGEVLFLLKLFTVTVIFVLIIAIKMTRHRTRHEVLATIFFGILMNLVTDMYLDLKYHLYWYFDKDQVELEYLIVPVGQVGVLLIIFNYFPLYSHVIKKMLYIIGWTGILLLLELYAVHIDVLHYGIWNRFYSAFVYFISMYILYFVMHYTADSRENK